MTRLSVIVACALLAVACGDRELTKVPTQREANEILVALQEEGIGADVAEVGEESQTRLAIVVSEGWFGGDQIERARRVLFDRGLPRPVDKGLEGAYENQGLIPSGSAQAAQRRKEQETEVERQLRELTNVIGVDVNIASPERNDLALDPKRATAAVIIRHRGEKFVATPEQVQHTVARSVPDLPVENVYVMLSPYHPPAVSNHAADARRRNNLFIAGGAGLAIVLCALLLVFVLQIRRHKAQLAAGRLSAEADAPTDDRPQLRQPETRQAETAAT